jgi:hypothetical protein
VSASGEKLFKRTVLLNALPLNAIPFHIFAVACNRVTLTDIADVVARSEAVENYIRHESTVKLLSRLLNVDLKPSSGLYEYRNSDVLVIVTLKKQQRGQEIEAREEDLEYFTCVVLT